MLLSPHPDHTVIGWRHLRCTMSASRFLGLRRKGSSYRKKWKRAYEIQPVVINVLGLEMGVKGDRGRYYFRLQILKHKPPISAASLVKQGSQGVSKEPRSSVSPKHTPQRRAHGHLPHGNTQARPLLWAGANPPGALEDTSSGLGPWRPRCNIAIQLSLTFSLQAKEDHFFSLSL